MQSSWSKGTNLVNCLRDVNLSFTEVKKKERKWYTDNFRSLFWISFELWRDFVSCWISFCHATYKKIQQFSIWFYISVAGSVTSPHLAELALLHEDWKRRGSPCLCLGVKLELGDMERQSEVRDTKQNMKGQDRDLNNHRCEPLLEWKMFQKDCFVQSVWLSPLAMHRRGGSSCGLNDWTKVTSFAAAS